MKRIDGNDKLTASEKCERDERVQSWLKWMRKVRAIERIHEAAERHGWYTLTADEIKQAVTFSASVEKGLLTMPGDGVYRIIGRHGDTYDLRKIESFKGQVKWDVE